MKRAVIIEGTSGAVELTPGPLAGSIWLSRRNGREGVLLNGDQAVKVAAILAEMAFTTLGASSAAAGAGAVGASSKSNP